MKVRYTARARNDIEEIYSYIASHNPQAARHVRRSVLSTIAVIARLPYIDTKNARSPDLRSRLVSRYPYRVHYTVSAGEILIVHFRHASRRPLDWSP